MRFSTLGFFSTPGSPDSLAKGVLNIDSNCRSNSIQFDVENRLRAMLSIFVGLIMPNLKFYFTAMGQARSPMTDFLIDCYLNGFCKGRKNFCSRYCCFEVWSLRGTVVRGMVIRGMVVRDTVGVPPLPPC
jgi:hypothetical protein